MVVTVDDLPGVTRYYRTPEEKALMTDKLLGHFKIHRAPAIGFVVSRWVFDKEGRSVDPAQLALLTKWLDADLELGNHTYEHKDYNQVSFQELSADILGGEKATRELVEKRGRSFRYFRHPYLRRGNTASKKDSLEQFLKARGYQEAPVTVDNHDYLFSGAYDNALLSGDSSLAARIGKQYLTYMTDYVAYYEAQSDSLFGRQIPQTLLIHANTINADYVGELLKLLRQRGYAFVSLAEALTDEAYRSPDAFVGKAGISWMHRWALTRGKKGAFFQGEPEVPASIAELAEKR